MVKNKKDNKKIVNWDKGHINTNSSFKADKAIILVSQFLRSHKIFDLKLIDDMKREELFVMGVEKYKNGAFSIDELSELSERLWWSMENKDCYISDTFLAGAELSFYERYAVESENNAKAFIEYLKQVLSYKKNM